MPFGAAADSQPEMIKGLTAASGFLRGEVGRRVGLRHAPRLTFVLDDSFDKAARMEALLAAGHKPVSMTSGILLLDKPQGLSSNAAVQKVRRAFGRVKAGHTGSLDPLATGMLPVCLGEATKVAGYLLEGDKDYAFTARFGAAQTTGDLEGEVVEEAPVPPDLAAQLAGVLPAFPGPDIPDSAHVFGDQAGRPAAVQAGAAGHRSGARAPVGDHPQLELLSVAGDEASLRVQLLQGHLCADARRGHRRGHGLCGPPDAAATGRRCAFPGVADGDPGRRSRPIPRRCTAARGRGPAALPRAHAGRGADAQAQAGSDDRRRGRRGRRCC